VAFHVFVDFLLKVDADSAVCANYFIRADSSRSGDVPSRVGDADVSGIVADTVMRALDGGNDEPVKDECLGSHRVRGLRDRLSQGAKKGNREKQRKRAGKKTTRLDGQ
jgi:hypothetical protein